jgi:signal transduction histidine kinase
MGLDQEPTNAGATDPRPDGPGEDPLRLDVGFEYAADGQVETDGQGLILRANHAAAGLLNCPKEFLPGKPLGLFVADGYRARFYESLARLWQGVSTDTFETTLTRRASRPRDVLVVSSAGAPSGIFRWVFRDVTVLRQAEADRAELLRRLVTAQEDERRRVARDLHDSVGQIVTALALGIESVAAAGPLPPSAVAALGLVRRSADALSRAVRELGLYLRPVALDDLGLHAALGQLIAGWSTQRPECGLEFQADALANVRLPSEVETAVYRVVQEALTNAFRHARANHVRVVLESHVGLATATVQDDGTGFDPEASRDPTSGRRLGLAGMRERVALAGGTLEIRSRPGEGTTVVARFPVPDGNPTGA